MSNALSSLVVSEHPVWLEPLAAVGIPYVWGAGDLTDTGSWPRGAHTPLSRSAPAGYDCSGFVLSALANCTTPAGTKLNLPALRAKYGTDMHSASIADSCDKVTSPRPGDVFYYSGHVMLVIGGKRMLLVGASGGRSSTFGNRVDAYVKVVRWDYRDDLITAMRFKPEYTI